MADGNVDASFCLAVLLRLSNHQVWEVRSTAEALALVPGVEPDMLILGLGAANGDPFEAARILRRRPGERRGPLLVAVSPRRGDDDDPSWQRAGFDRVMARPLDIPALFALLCDPGAADAIGSSRAQPAG